MVKSENNNINTILLVLLLAGLLFMAYSVIEEKIIDSPEETAELVTGINYCDSYTNNYPSYFFVKEIQCNAAGGDYVCDSDNMGCYDITTWDNTLCGSAQVQALKVFCSTLSGDWTCTATEISCESI